MEGEEREEVHLAMRRQLVSGHWILLFKVDRSWILQHIASPIIAAAAAGCSLRMRWSSSSRSCHERLREREVKERMREK